MIENRYFDGEKVVHLAGWLLSIKMIVEYVSDSENDPMNGVEVLFSLFEQITFKDPANRSGVVPEDGAHFCPLVSSARDDLWARFTITRANALDVAATLEIYTPTSWSQAAIGGTVFFLFVASLDVKITIGIRKGMMVDSPYAATFVDVYKQCKCLAGW